MSGRPRFTLMAPAPATIHGTVQKPGAVSARILLLLGPWLHRVGPRQRPERGSMRGMRTAFIVSLVGDLIAAGAVLFLMDRPAAYLIAAALVVAPVGLYLLLLRPFVQSEALEARGAPAAATVLEVWDTGWTINENPQVGLRLEVRPPGDVPFEAKTKMVVSRLVVGQIRPGAALEVRYDPRDKRRVAVVSGTRPAPALHAAERLAELEELRRQGLVTEEEYEAKRQAILDEV